jgi:hypothetical protein
MRNIISPTAALNISISHAAIALAWAIRFLSYLVHSQTLH